MKFDKTTSGKIAVAMVPDTLATGADGNNEVSTAVAVDTAGYESCNLLFEIIADVSGGNLGNCTADTGVPITITECDTSDGDYKAVDVDRVIAGDDATYTATSKVLTVDADDITDGYLFARVGLVNTKRYIKATLANIGDNGEDDFAVATILCDFGDARYSSDFFDYDAVPSQA